MGALLEMFKRKVGAKEGLEHRGSSTQTDPIWEEYLRTNERINPNQGLEAPLLDPLDPFLLPKTLPAKIIKLMGEAAARGVSPPRRIAQSGAINPGSIFDYLLPSGKPSTFSSRLPTLDPTQLEALKIYTDNSALFQPVRIPQQKAALQHALAKKQITQGQMENIDNLRLALDEALLQDLHLPGPIYRGLRDFDQAPKMGDILGGYHPASFSYDPDLVMKEFMGNFATDNAMIQIPRNHTVQGLVVPKHAFGPAGDESEVLLHPNTRLLMNKVDDSDYGKVMTSKPTFDTDGPEYDIGGWKDGGLIKEPKWEQLEGGYLLR